MPFVVLFILVSAIELAVLIKVGSFIGVFWTIMLILATAVIGVNLLKRQGMEVLMRANPRMSEGSLPASELAEGFLLALAGALLLTPGFVTDSVGFLLLAPGVRKAMMSHVIKFIKPKVVVAGGGFASRQPGGQPFESQPFEKEVRGSHYDRKPEVIEGEYRRED